MNPKITPKRNEPEHAASDHVRTLVTFVCYLETRSGHKVRPERAYLARRELASKARPSILRGATLSRGAGAPCRPLQRAPLLDPVYIGHSNPSGLRGPHE